MTDAKRREIARQATRKERERCAAICVKLAEYEEAKANVKSGPVAEQLRQAARMIREGDVRGGNSNA